ncbi:MAG: DUF4190 domain-containing protein [Verrucomicrobia bacterium]|nr:DUF4190 domain-containing protein [Verrucomicrobiota bacterium]
MFKIIGGDGTEYGPVSAADLRQWMAQGRANAATRARRDGTGDWKTLGDFPEFAAVGGPPPMPAAAESGSPRKTSGLAITSLVLGILGPCTALFGLILGIMALSKIKNSGGRLRGHGLAIAGICVSGVFLVVGMIAIPAAVMVPSLSKAKDRSGEIRCMSNMKQIALGCKMWGTDNNDQFPPSLSALTNELGITSVLICPKAQPTSPPVPWSQFDFSKVTYVYEPPPTNNTDLGRVFLRCPLHGHTALVDGSVQRGSHK